MALLTPGLLLVSLSLADGGFGLQARHVAGIGAWLAVIALLATGRAGRIEAIRPVFVCSGLILAVAALSLVSSLWSGSVERSFTEAGRVLVYLSFFLLALLVTQTATLRKRFAEGVVAAIGVVVLLALASRLMPDLVAMAEPYAQGPRLRFPIGYWNAIGVFTGIGVALLLWLRLAAGQAPARWLATGLIPAFLLTLYFTYSRGGLLAAGIALITLLALSRHRLRHLVTLLLATAATVPALIAVQSREALADGLNWPERTGQGLEVLAFLLLGIAALLAAVWACRGIARARPVLTERLVELSRRASVLRAIGLTLAGGVLILAAVYGGRVWEEFSDPSLQFPARPEEHFGNLSGAGRYEFWRVAVEGFGQHPLLGSGAGTYEFTWRALREIDVPVLDAHSVYLEAFSELGLLGGLLVLALFAGLLGIGGVTWHRARGPQRELAAAMLAMMAAFTVGAGLDWFWEIAAMGALFFLAAGVLVSVRCDQLTPEPGPEPTAGNGRRYAAAISGLIAGWVAIAILAGPLIMQYELTRSQEAAAEDRIAEAVDHALTARSLQPWAASPYVQLGGLAELEGEYRVALDHYDEASERESDSWQIWYLKAQVARELDQDDRADRYLDRARELNPRAPELQDRADDSA